MACSPLTCSGVLLIIACALPATAADGPVTQDLGRRVFVDTRDPPAYVQSDQSRAAAFDLGHAVFNTQWVVAGTAGAARRDGVGPLFNATSCDACHNEGARGRGPSGDGPAPVALVIQLEQPASSETAAGQGDPRYGHVLNTAAIDGLIPEAAVTVHYTERNGRYADGMRWSLRVPQYEISQLRYGPLAAGTLIKPRLAPPLFGVGLLESVVDDDPAHDGAGRFGWQGAALSIRDQTTKAFAREMGLTSSDVNHDDCTTAEQDCLTQNNGGAPEVSAELLDALIEFQRWLAVPITSSEQHVKGSAKRLFAELGCTQCHRASLRVSIPEITSATVIHPYTDLRLHDLGSALADADASGRSVPSKWRTPPLWGLMHGAQANRMPTYLHDGRARSIEEAILWHDGEAAIAKENFLSLAKKNRTALLEFLATL